MTSLRPAATRAPNATSARAPSATCRDRSRLLARLATPSALFAASSGRDGLWEVVAGPDAAA